MVKFGVLASEELKIIGRLLTYKYRNSQGLDAREFSDVVDMLNVTVNGESFNASHFSNNDAVGSLDSKDTERKTVRLCYGTDPELFVIQVIDNLINTTGNERLKKWAQRTAWQEAHLDMFLEWSVHIAALSGSSSACRFS